MSSNSGLVIILVVFFAFVGFLMLGLSGIDWVKDERVSTITSPAAVAHDFMSCVTTDYAGTAYQLTSRGFQERQSLEQFRAFLKKHPDLANADYTVSQTDTSDRGTLFRAVIRTEGDAAIRADLTVVEEDGRWKVDEFILR